MASKGISVRVDEELLAWADSYAEHRGVSRTTVVDMALQALKEDVRGGVPDLPAKVERARSAVPGIKTAAEVRADPARAAGLARMARLYGKS